VALVSPRPAAALLVVVSVSVLASGSVERPRPRAPELAAPPPEPEPVPPLEEDQALADLTERVHRVIASWQPPSGLPQADLGEVAYTIARVARDQPAPRRAAALLMSLAFFEGFHFARFVDDGSCNRVTIRVEGRRQWREGPKLPVKADCDHGDAYSLWQVHERGGMPARALGERDFAARAALAIAARDPSLCGYTGEAANPLSTCPKARERLAFARRAESELDAAVR
jgi:hypothetical protein